MVRTKMVVSEIQHHGGVRRDPETGVYRSRDVHKVRLHACDGGVPEDLVVPIANSAGPLELDLSELELPDFFEVGRTYYLEFSPAE